jgi:DNA-binding CsgD family transcriptional regulator
VALDALAGLLAADGAALVRFGCSSPDQTWSDGIADLITTFFDRDWYKNSIRAQRLLRDPRSLESALTEVDLFSRDELDRHPFNAELINRLGYRHFAAVRLSPREQRDVVLSLQRKRRRGPFSPSELTILQLLMPQLRMAATMARMAGLDRGRAVLDIFEQLGVGCVLLGANAKALDMNAAVERYIPAFLQIQDGRLTTTDSSMKAQLGALISNTMETRLDGRKQADHLIIRDRLRGSAVVEVAPIRYSVRDLFSGIMGLLLIREPHHSPEFSTDVLRRAFGLTRSEAEIAVQVTSGRAVADIAKSRGVSVGTLRNQIKSIFAKTATSSRAQLTALLTHAH